MTRWQPPQPTAVLVLATGDVLYGFGVGAIGETVGEVCFNTAMTGYQEILTDPSYAGQIVTFTFPHIGNIGTTDEDDETSNQITPDAACGLIIRESITNPSNYRSQSHLDDWLKARGIMGISGIDTRAITLQIGATGMFHAALAHHPNGMFDIAKLAEKAARFGGLEGADLAAQVTTKSPYEWAQSRWAWANGFGESQKTYKVVALDFGAKKNILRCLASVDCEVIILPATSTAEEVLAHQPDGIFLSNGPGDPAATAASILPEIETLIAIGKPIFGICLGHQILSLALGAQTMKMPQGHHGANHPVKDLQTGKVEITSMNHGFTVDRDTLPAHIMETHISLFDGTNCGIRVKDKPIFSVQYHPEASPGPQDSHYLFADFAAALKEAKHA